jgi:DNA-binding NarL/FixJ family response regulator
MPSLAFRRIAAQHNLERRVDTSRAAVRRRILIVEDHRFFAACLRAVLDNEPDLMVCDLTARPADLAERIIRHQPDALVIDLTLGNTSGLEVALRLRERGIFTPILFISSLCEPSREQLAEVLNCGFLPKARTPAEFLRTLRELLAPEKNVLAATHPRSRVTGAPRF